MRWERPKDSHLLLQSRLHSIWMIFKYFIDLVLRFKICIKEFPFGENKRKYTLTHDISGMNKTRDFQTKTEKKRTYMVNNTARIVPSIRDI